MSEMPSMSELKNDARKEARKAKDRAAATLEEEIEVLREDVTRLAATLRQLVGEITADVMDATRERVDRVSEDVYAAGTQARERAEAAATNVEDAVGRHPFAAILISAGLGFLLSQLMRK